MGNRDGKKCTKKELNIESKRQKGRERKTERPG